MIHPMRQPIKIPSRVPAYQNLLEVDGFCDFQVASPPYREGLGLGGCLFLTFSAPEKVKHRYDKRKKISLKENQK